MQKPGQRWRVPAFMLSAVFCLILFKPQNANAIAAWARKYGNDCGMCHTNVNRLNKTGRDFLVRGHRMPDEDNAEKKSISDYWSLTQKIRYVSEEGKSDGFDIEAFSLYLGGPLDKNFSFFTEYYMHESNAAQSDREKLAAAYLMYTLNDTKNPANFTTLKAGQIEPYLLHYHGTGGRLPISRPYVFNDAEVKPTGTTTGDYLFRYRQRNYGLEIGRVYDDMGLLTYLGVVNGTGHKPPNKSGDNNSHKDVYFTLEKTLGDQGSSVGLFGYWGKYPEVDGGKIFSTEKYKRYALIGDYTTERFTLFGSYVLGTDDIRQNFGGGSQDSKGYFLEGNYFVNSATSWFARFDNFDPNDAVANDDTDQTVLGVSQRLGDFSRATLEYQTKKTGAAAATDKFTLEIQWMY